VRPLLVGEANPYGGDPEYALWPAPRGCAGDRLCRLVLQMGEEEYLDRFERVNLCPSTWSIRVAREQAARLRSERDGPVVLLGAKVCDAFRMAFLPFTARVWPEHGARQLRFVTLPHPSGLSRLWNEPGAYARARQVLREAGAVA
jgi:hypothetical protein